MPKQPLTPAGKRLREVREQAGITQQQVEVEANLGFGYLQRLELGKVTNPKKATLERILTTLNASYNEWYEILKLFGYQVSTPLPTDDDIAWAVQNSATHLQHCPYPAYLLDCAYRLWSWNDYVPALIGHAPDSLKMAQFRGKSVVEVIFDEQYGLAPLADNPDEIFSTVLLTFRVTLHPYQDEEWCQEMTANLLTLPLFKKYWDMTEPYQEPANRPTHPVSFFRINVPGGESRSFRVLSFPFSPDRRFLIVEYIPYYLSSG